MLSDDLRTFQHLWESVCDGHIEIKPDGMKEIGRFLGRAVAEIEALEAMAGRFQDVDQETLARETRTDGVVVPFPTKGDAS